MTSCENLRKALKSQHAKMIRIGGRVVPLSFRLSVVRDGKKYHEKKHRHAKRARVFFFGDRSIRRTVHSNDLV